MNAVTSAFSAAKDNRGPSSQTSPQKVSDRRWHEDMTRPKRRKRNWVWGATWERHGSHKPSYDHVTQRCKGTHKGYGLLSCQDAVCHPCSPWQQGFNNYRCDGYLFHLTDRLRGNSPPSLWGFVKRNNEWQLMWNISNDILNSLIQHNHNDLWSNILGLRSGWRPEKTWGKHKDTNKTQIKIVL